ncbi:MAG: hypothetical protein NW226_17120 [Microscillaceae bacterium]|nr:hypothetical protein [Microscillaceae bacterium]
MRNEDFNTVLLSDSQNVLLKYPRLANLFVTFSLLFSASIVGLFINLIINMNRPLTHSVFLLGILVSLLAGIGLNMIANRKARRSAQKHIESLLKGKEY